MSDVTQILQAVERGDAKAAHELLPLVYKELRRLAARKMANEAPGHTLQPTALVHEAWLRLVGNDSAHWDRHAPADRDSVGGRRRGGRGGRIQRLQQPHRTEPTRCHRPL